MSKAQLTFTENRVKSSFYPSLVLAELVNEADSTTPVAVEHFEGPLIVKGNGDSTVGLKVNDGEQIFGGKAVFNGLLSTFQSTLGSDPLFAEWVDFAYDRLTATDFQAQTNALLELDDHLVLRTYIVGHVISVADVAVWGVIKGNPAAAGILKRGGMPNVERWYNHIANNKTTLKAAEFLLAKKRVKSSTSNYEIGLPDTEKGVVTRFPPEPSGYMHIGHTKAAMLNSYFATKYNGKLIIRFDDTNPSKEKEEFQDAILEDCKSLGINYNVVTYTSDSFDKIYELAIQMIKDGNAYCDDTEKEKMQYERMHGIESVRRNRTVEENLAAFEEMKNYTEEGRKNCLRAKISVDNPNKAMRDPVIYRCNDEPHHRTGTKWKIYPTYDFACPIVDSLEGVTHALRTTEYRDRNAQYAWMLEKMNLRKVHIWDFGRVNFVRTLMSKRKLTWFVEEKLVSGWEDPRFPTVRGILRHGMTVDALREFIYSQGPSKNVVNMEWAILWAINKKYIDPVAPRFTAIPDENAVKAIIVDGPEPAVIEQKPRHVKNPAVGTKAVYFSKEVLIDQVDAASFAQGEEITLMAWGNAFVTKITKDGDKVTGLELKLHLEGDFKKTEKKVTWLSTAQSTTPVELVYFDHLITKDKLEETDKFEDFINPKSEWKTIATSDENIKTIKKGDIIQFERIGYFRCDEPYETGKPAIFFNIPSGKK